MAASVSRSQLMPMSLAKRGWVWTVIATSGRSNLGAVEPASLTLRGSNELSDRVIKRTLADLRWYRVRISTIGRKTENC
jgi:hypothetical protein